MDETDRRLLQALRRNGREKFLTLSKELGISESTVRKRIKALESEGVIQYYTAVVEPRKIGFDAVAIVCISVDSSKLLDVVKELSKVEEIEFVSTCTGEYSVIIEVWKKNVEDISDFISKKIAVIGGVTKINPIIMLKKYTRSEAVGGEGGTGGET